MVATHCREEKTEAESDPHPVVILQARGKANIPEQVLGFQSHALHLSLLPPHRSSRSVCRPGGLGEEGLEAKTCVLW